MQQEVVAVQRLDLDLFACVTINVSSVGLSAAVSPHACLSVPAAILASAVTVCGDLNCV